MNKCIDCGKSLPKDHPFTYCDADWENHYPTPATNEHKDQASKHVDELFKHEQVIKDAGLWDYRDEILNIANGLFTTGMKLANNLEYKALDTFDYDEKWNMIDAKKLRYVKRLCLLLSEQQEALLTQFTQELIEGQPKERTVDVDEPDDDVFNEAIGFNQALTESTQSIKATLTKYTGGK